MRVGLKELGAKCCREYSLGVIMDNLLFASIGGTDRVNGGT